LLLVGYLTRNTSRDDNDVSARECLLETIICWEETLDLSNGGDVGEIGGYARCVDDIVKGELVDEWARLEEEGKRLVGSLLAVPSHVYHGWYRILT